MTVGAFLSVIAYSLLGPLPFMKLPLKLSIFLTGYIIFAISYTGDYFIFYLISINFFIKNNLF